jgi:hypothetical protein
VCVKRASPKSRSVWVLTNFVANITWGLLPPASRQRAGIINAARHITPTSNATTNQMLMSGSFAQSR